jgi:hypothetical protein
MIIELVVFLVCLLGYLCLPPLFDDAPASPSPSAAEAAPIGLAIATALILSLLLVAASLALSAAPAAPAEEKAGSSPILSSFGFESGTCEEMASRDIPLHTHYERDSTLAMRIPSQSGRCEGATRRASTWERDSTLATGGAHPAHRCAGATSAHSPFWKRAYIPPTVMVTAEYDVYGFDADGREIVAGKIVLFSHTAIASPMWRVR